MLNKFVVSPSREILSLFVFCALTFMAAFACAQSTDDVHIVPRNEPSTAPDIIPGEIGPSLLTRAKPLRVNVGLVLVPVAVSDAMNRPVLTLKRQDFELYEDEKPQEIRYFGAEAEPASVAILVDVSKSMTDKLDTEKAAIGEFFKNADPRDEYFAIAFSNRPRLLADSTQSVEEMQSKLTTVEPGGSTAMLDAVYLAESVLRSARYKRKAIVIISDGGDNASRYTLREIKQIVEESDVQIYAIGLFETFFFNTLEERMGKRWLSEITDVTGGHTVTVDSRTKLPEAAGEISREIRSTYVLGYTPGRGIPNRWRRIKIRIFSSSAPAPLRFHYKEGYFTNQ